MKWISRTVVVLEDRIDMNKPIHAYGVDSLTAAGLRNRFAKAFGVNIAVFEVLAGASFRQLGFAAARRRKRLRLVGTVKIGFVALKNARLIEVSKEGASSPFWRLVTAFEVLITLITPRLHTNPVCLYTAPPDGTDTVAFFAYPKVKVV